MSNKWLLSDSLRSPQSHTLVFTMKKIVLTIIIFFLISINTFSEQRENGLLSVVSEALKNDKRIYDFNELISNGEWNADKTAIVIHIPDGLSSLLYVFLRQDDGTFIAVDLSYRVNNEMNYKLGRRRNYYDKYVQTPVVCNRQDGYAVGVGIRTQAWKNGQRYTVESKPTRIKKNGERLDP